MTLHPGARRFEATGFHRPSVIGFARACGWLSMYIGLPWAHGAGRAPGAGRRGPARGHRRGVARHAARQRRDPRHVPDRGLDSGRAANELGARAFAILRNIPPIDAIRISVGFWNTEEELETLARTRRAARRPHAGDDPAAPDAGHPGQRWPADRLTRARASRADAAAGGPAARVRRGPLAPVPARAPPGVRAVASSLSWRWSWGSVPRLRRRARPRGGRSRAATCGCAFLAAYVAIVLLAGSVITWLVVPLPTGRRRRSADAHAVEPRARPVRGRPDRLSRARGAPRDHPAAAHLMRCASGASAPLSCAGARPE